MHAWTFGLHGPLSQAADPAKLNIERKHRYLLPESTTAQIKQKSLYMLCATRAPFYLPPDLGRTSKKKKRQNFTNFATHHTGNTPRDRLKWERRHKQAMFLASQPTKAAGSHPRDTSQRSWIASTFTFKNDRAREETATKYKHRPHKMIDVKRGQERQEGQGLEGMIVECRQTNVHQYSTVWNNHPTPHP